MLPEKESTCWLLTFSPTKPLILGGTVPYIYIIYIYTSYIMLSDIISQSVTEAKASRPTRMWRKFSGTVPWNSPGRKLWPKPGVPEILQDLMVKKWILDVSESFGQFNTQWKTSAKNGSRPPFKNHPARWCGLNADPFNRKHMSRKNISAYMNE